MTPSHYEWFQCFGIEIEYMIVDRKQYSVQPISDRILVDEQGNIQSELERDTMAWSNELLAHVIELKTNGPVASLQGVAEAFQQEVTEINRRLLEVDCQLMPTGMHPWMDPITEKKLWEHDYHEVYETFDRIFDCSGHGWANLQSMHINLPFHGEEQFRQLHSAIRFLLPILPGLAASSPIVERVSTGIADNRMEFYRKNSRRIPEIAGLVIPELILSSQDYQQQILQRIYDATAPFDPQGILRFEWCNSRGAITRFDRGAIEIRVLDAQECPAADLAIADLIIAVLKDLVEKRAQQIVATSPATELGALSDLFLDCVRYGEKAEILNSGYLNLLGITEMNLRVGELWTRLLERHRKDLLPSSLPYLETICQQGTLASRILRSAGPKLNQLTATYQQLCDCLAQGKSFSVAHG